MFFGKLDISKKVKLDILSFIDKYIDLTFFWNIDFTKKNIEFVPSKIFVDLTFLP